MDQKSSSPIMDFIKFNIYILFFSLSNSILFSQQITQAKFVVEKGKFIFDKKSYKLYKNQLEEIEQSNKKMDSLLKANPKLHISEIDDRIISYPRLITKTESTPLKFIKNLDLNNIILGKNLMSIIIDKNGIAKKIKCIEITDNKICKQIKKMLKKEEFKYWEIPQFSSINVNFDFRFSIIVDSSFSKYNLKNKWSLENNLSEFKK